MARIIVVGGEHTVYMDEEVIPLHLNDQHHAIQVLERLAWALEDADRETVGNTVRKISSYREVAAG